MTGAAGAVTEAGEAAERDEKRGCCEIAPNARQASYGLGLAARSRNAVPRNSRSAAAIRIPRSSRLAIVHLVVIRREKSYALRQACQPIEAHAFAEAQDLIG
jgi:hypothetical protein